MCLAHKQIERKIEPFAVCLVRRGTITMPITCEAGKNTDRFDNATIGAGTWIEPDVEVGWRYQADCGPATIGRNSILRKGTIIYGDVHVGDCFQTAHYVVVRAMVTAGDYCTMMNHSCIEGIVRMGDGVRIMSHVYIPSRTWLAITCSSGRA